MRVTPVKTISLYAFLLIALLSIGCYSDEEEEVEPVTPYIVTEGTGDFTPALMPTDRPMELRGEFGCSYYCSPDVDVFAVQYQAAGTYSLKVRYNVPDIGGTYIYRDKDGNQIAALSTTAPYDDEVEADTVRLISINQGSYYSHAEYDYAIEIVKNK
jgi:hypothetical protein